METGGCQSAATDHVAKDNNVASHMRLPRLKAEPGRSLLGIVTYRVE